MGHCIMTNPLDKYRIFPIRSPGFHYFFHDFFPYNPGLLLGWGYYQDGACIIFFTKKSRIFKFFLKKNKKIPSFCVIRMTALQKKILCTCGKHEISSSSESIQCIYQATCFGHAYMHISGIKKIVAPGYYQNRASIFLFRFFFL